MATTQLMSLKVSPELFKRVRACAHRLSLTQDREVRWTTLVKEALEEAVQKVEEEISKQCDLDSIRF